MGQVTWKQRTVYIVFDSDAETKDGVRLAQLQLAFTLEHRKAIVKVVTLPAK